MTESDPGPARRGVGRAPEPDRGATPRQTPQQRPQARPQQRPDARQNPPAEPPARTRSGRPLPPPPAEPTGRTPSRQRPAQKQARPAEATTERPTAQRPAARPTTQPTATTPQRPAQPAQKAASQKAAPEKATGKAPARKPRKARLRLVQVDAWSVMKTSFLLSIAIGIVTVVAVTIVWTVLGAAGVFDSLNDTIQTVMGNSFRLQDYLGTGRIVGFTMLVAAVDVVLLTAIATLGAFLYNLAATLLGGIEVTLAEDN